MTNTVTLPKALTAENGAKAALIGEFFETVTIECTECEGSGTVGSWDDYDECPVCDGTGKTLVKVPVTWTTIKAIYNRIVALYGE